MPGRALAETDLLFSFCFYMIQANGHMNWWRKKILLVKLAWLMFDIEICFI